MERRELRLMIRKVLAEGGAMAIGGTGWDSNNDVARFHGSPSGYGEFPYLEKTIPEMMPSPKEIRDSNSTGFGDYVGNNEVYEFPMEQFHVGLEKETENLKGTASYANVFDIAKIVLDNLQKDKTYYLENNGSSENEGGIAQDASSVGGS